MRVHRSIALAAWVLERLSAGVDGRALAGDLLEELEAGRSERWFWRQAACAVAANALAASRVYALPMIFSAGWSLLYPGWMAIGRSVFPHTILSYSHFFEWPYFASLELVLGVLPVTLFVWVGLLVYLLSPLCPFRRLSPRRLLAGFSIGFNVLMTASAVLLPHASFFRGMGLQYRLVENFYTNIRLVIVIMPLTLSLYAAILSARPRRRSQVAVG